VVEGLLGKSFDGTLTSDFYSAYDRLDCPKQRCVAGQPPNPAPLAHLLRELRETAEKHPAFAAGTFCRKAVRLVKDMLALKREWDELGDEYYTRRARRLEDRLEQLAKAEYDEPDAARLAKRLRRHRAELTRFLWDRDLDGTNNAAERALRPAVVMRKITGGSRSARGARAWAKLASLMRTASQQGRNVLETVKQLLVEHWAGKPAMALTSGP
jgi:transposase